MSITYCHMGDHYVDTDEHQMDTPDVCQSCADQERDLIDLHKSKSV